MENARWRHGKNGMCIEIPVSDPREEEILPKDQSLVAEIGNERL